MLRVLVKQLVVNVALWLRRLASYGRGLVVSVRHWAFRLLVRAAPRSSLFFSVGLIAVVRRYARVVQARLVS